MIGGENIKTKIDGIIIEKKCNDEKIINELLYNNGIIGIYGCGDIASNIFGYLQCNKIRVSYFIVDDEYYYEEKHMGLPVNRLSDIIQKRICVDGIIVGFSDIKKSFTNLQKIEADINIYCISNPYVYLKQYDLNAEFYQRNITGFFDSFSLFEDELSREIYIAYLNTRINRNYKYLLPFGGENTYFSNDVIFASYDEVYVDCGAYNGDSIINFLTCVNYNYTKIIAIEPDPENFRQLKASIESRNLNNIDLLNKGVWTKRAVLGFSASGKQEGTVVNNAISQYIEVDSLDKILKTEEITLLKLSVQGAEEEALKGAENILRVKEPKLAITIFMKPDALIKIPYLIKKINPRYKLYLRCMESFFAKVILYAKVN